MMFPSFLLAFAGLLMLAISMPRHRDQMFGRGTALPMAGWIRPAAWIVLALSLAICFAGQSASIAATWWVGLLTLAAAPILLLLTYRPRALPLLGVASLTLALLSAALQITP